MKHALGVALLYAVGGCALDAPELSEDGFGSRSERQAMMRPNTGPALQSSTAAFPVVLGEITAHGILFTVEPQWDCGKGEPAPATVIYVCKTEGPQEDAKRTRRCYAVKPDGLADDPYLQCADDGASLNCHQKILQNGSYHVGALYEGSDCGSFEFWWQGVHFVERDLSASLQPVDRKRHLDHRMFRVLEQPELQGNDRWIPKRTSLRLDFEFTDAVTSDHVWVHGPGLSDVAYDETLDADGQSPRGVIPPCQQAEFSRQSYGGEEPPPPNYTNWHCPIVPGLPLRIDVDLYGASIANDPFWLDVHLGSLPTPIPEDSRVRFDGIVGTDTVFLPHVNR